MNCIYHHDQEAHAVCLKCSQPVCPECMIEVAGKTFCRPCLEQIVVLNTQPNNQPGAFSGPPSHTPPAVLAGTQPGTVPRRTFWQNFSFFIFSLIPGAAHMHLGLFRRGLQLMLLFFGFISIASYLGTDFLIPFVIVPTCFFSFFESYHLRKRIDQGEPLPDQDLFDLKLLSDSPLLKSRRLIGMIILIMGVLALLNTLNCNGLMYRLLGPYEYIIRQSLIPLLLIIGGIYLILKAKKRESIPLEPDKSNSP